MSHRITVGQEGFLVGYRPPEHPTNSFGALSPTSSLGRRVWQLTANTSGNVCVLQYADNAKVGEAVVVTWPTVGDVTYAWNGAQGRYDTTNAAVASLLSANVGLGLDLVIGQVSVAGDQLNDCILAATGGPTVPDGLLAYYRANGATSANRVDAEGEFLAAQGFGTGDLGDRWYAYLGSLGYTGSLNDRLLAFWCGATPPTPPGGSEQFQFDIETGPESEYGYATINAGGPYGTLTPGSFLGYTVHRILANNDTKLVVLALGAMGNVQIPGVTQVRMTIFGGSPSILTFAAGIYSIVDTGLADLIVGLEGSPAQPLTLETL